jgi:hypothetical protein
MSRTHSPEDRAHPGDDTVRLPMLDTVQVQVISETTAEIGVDPYQTGERPRLVRDRRPRRTLDDMRQLSETIKSTRSREPGTD